MIKKIKDILNNENGVPDATPILVISTIITIVALLCLCADKFF